MKEAKAKLEYDLGILEKANIFYISTFVFEIKKFTQCVQNSNLKPNNSNMLM